jgi:hypothetical protein
VRLDPASVRYGLRLLPSRTALIRDASRRYAAEHQRVCGRLSSSEPPQTVHTRAVIVSAPHFTPPLASFLVHVLEALVVGERFVEILERVKLGADQLQDRMLVVTQVLRNLAPPPLLTQVVLAG